MTFCSASVNITFSATGLDGHAGRIPQENYGFVLPGEGEAACQLSGSLPE